MNLRLFANTADIVIVIEGGPIHDQPENDSDDFLDINDVPICPDDDDDVILIEEKMCPAHGLPYARPSRFASSIGVMRIPNTGWSCGHGFPICPAQDTKGGRQ